MMDKTRWPLLVTSMCRLKVEGKKVSSCPATSMTMQMPKISRSRKCRKATIHFARTTTITRAKKALTGLASANARCNALTLRIVASKKYAVINKADL